ncbi:MAG: thioredoxin family protein [Bacillota bacterium]
MKIRSAVLAFGLIACASVFAAEKIYPEIARAAPDIEAAQKSAAASHKRILLDFGGNWCTDCIVLDRYMREPENAALLERFVVVHVNVGDKGITDNFPIAERYGIPLKKGVPALAVLDPDGKVVHSQKAGEFEDMRHMSSAAVRDFLNKWAGK